MSDSQSNLKKDESFGVIPIRQGDSGREFLLVQHQAGHWGFPKGHAEDGEEPREAAVRELREETGLADVALEGELEFAERYIYTKRSGKRVDKRVVYFVGQVRSGTVAVQEEEVQDFAWGDAAQTRARLTFDEGKALFERVLGYLVDGGA